MSENNPEIFDEVAFYKKKFLLSIIIPGIFVFLMWLVKIIEVLFDADFSFLGIYPLEMKGLPGILLSPFIHENFKHLFDNSIPLFFLGTDGTWTRSNLARQRRLCAPATPIWSTR